MCMYKQPTQHLKRGIRQQTNGFKGWTNRTWWFSPRLKGLVAGATNMDLISKAANKNRIIILIIISRMAGIRLFLPEQTRTPIICNICSRIFGFLTGGTPLLDIQNGWGMCKMTKTVHRGNTPLPWPQTLDDKHGCSPLQPKILRCWWSYNDCLSLGFWSKLEKTRGLANHSTVLCVSNRSSSHEVFRPGFPGQKRFRNLTFQTGEVPSVVKTCAKKTSEENRRRGEITFLIMSYRKRRGCRTKIFIRISLWISMVHGIMMIMWGRGAC